LSVLLNEPIPGHGLVWSSVSGTAYPVSVRVFSFEKLVSLADAQYRRAAVETFATVLRERHAVAVKAADHALVGGNGRGDGAAGPVARPSLFDPETGTADDEPIDALNVQRERA